jgi:hypothetical protein
MGVGGKANNDTTNAIYLKNVYQGIRDGFTKEIFFERL